MKVAGSLALALLLTSGCAALASQIGEAMDVTPDAASIRGSDTITLDKGTPLQADDLVKTEDHGRATLQFLDNTTLEVEPNSTTRLDRFVFNPDSTAKEITINLTKGVFRFVSGGRSDPKNYKIVTPHVTLGIRGTIIRVEVKERETNIYCGKGIGLVCNLFGRCVKIGPNENNNTVRVGGNGSMKVYAAKADPFQTGSIGGGPGQGGPLGSSQVDTAVTVFVPPEDRLQSIAFDENGNVTDQTTQQTAFLVTSPGGSLLDSRGAPGPDAGAGLPFLVAGLGYVIHRFRRKR